MNENEVKKHTKAECFTALFSWIALLVIFIFVYLKILPIAVGFLLVSIVVFNNIIDKQIRNDIKKECSIQDNKKEYLIEFISILTTSAIFLLFIYLSSYGLTRLVMDLI